MIIVSNPIYRVGHKVSLLSDNTNAQWSLSNSSIILENEFIKIDLVQIVQVNSISYSECVIRLKTSGNLSVYILNTSEELNITIEGIDILWVGKQTRLWNTDLGTLAKGITPDYFIQNINKWSLFKPIRNKDKNLAPGDIWEYSSLFQKNGAGMKVNLWKGINSLFTFNNFINSVNIEQESSWVYLAPRGADFGQEEYFRLGDFRGYTNKYNKSYISPPNPTIIYRKKLDGTYEWEGIESYTLENIRESGVLKMSDIWFGETEATNLGDFYLILYVRTPLGLEFFRPIIKLSEQNNGTFSIQPRLEELFIDPSLLGSYPLFSDKGKLVRHYFIGSNVLNPNTWKKLIIKSDGKSATEIPPVSTLPSKKELLTIFKDALALPVTENKKYIFTTDVRICTQTAVHFLNNTIVKRNCQLDLYKGEELLDRRFKYLEPEENNTFLVDNVLNLPEVSLCFANPIKGDVLNIEINSLYKYQYRTLEYSTDYIIIPILDILGNIPEQEWYNTDIQISLEDESFTFNFINIGNKPIQIDFIKASQDTPLVLDNINSEGVYYSNNSPYEFKNLYEYKFIVNNLEGDMLGDLTTIDVTSLSPLIYIDFFYDEEESYLEFIVTLTVQNQLLFNEDKIIDITIKLQ